MADWEAIAKKYRALVGDEEASSLKESDAESGSMDGAAGGSAGGGQQPPGQVGNNIAKQQPNV